MNTIIAISMAAIFLGLALLHFYWLSGGRVGLTAAIPEIDGKPAFQPSTAATLVVAIGLTACALLFAALAGLLAVPAPASVLAWLGRALALIFLIRAIGDFRLVGFFKRVRDSRFARLDTAIYSPFCLAMAIGAALVSLAPGA